MKYQHVFRKLNLTILALMAFATLSIEANTTANAGLKIDCYRNAIIQ
jgi:hypothetical protein